ncbi:MAG: AAA family ATPase [Bacillota bacterium]
MDEQLKFQSRTDLSQLNELIQKIRSEVKKIIVGQDNVIDLLTASILADGHVLIEGVPGVAKTLMAKILAKTISSGFSRIQFTPDLMPSDILGTSVFNMKTTEFEFNKGPIFSNIILIDEINRAPAKTQSALFEVMEERQISIDGNTYKMQEPFIVFATQNPVDQEGTYRLPEAELDRFLFKVGISYPSAEEETEILLSLHDKPKSNDLDIIEPVFSRETLASARAAVRKVHLDKNIAAYVSMIVSGTRNNRDIFLGASPRASLAIVSGAKAFAAMKGRDFISPDDVREVVFPALRHRILLTAEKEMEGSTAEEVIKMILDKIEVPR